MKVNIKERVNLFANIPNIRRIPAPSQQCHSRAFSYMDSVFRASHAYGMGVCLLLSRPDVEFDQINEFHHQIQQKSPFCLIQSPSTVQLAYGVNCRQYYICITLIWSTLEFMRLSKILRA